MIDRSIKTLRIKFNKSTLTHLYFNFLNLKELFKIDGIKGWFSPINYFVRARHQLRKIACFQIFEFHFVYLFMYF
jgi:hypothetical protein